MDKPLIEQLMDETVKQLLKTIRSGKGTAADMANALRLLKDNGIRLDPESGPARDLIQDIPFSEKEYKEMLEG